MSTNKEQSPNEQLKQILDAGVKALQHPTNERVQELTSLVELATLLALHGERLTQMIAITDIHRTFKYQLTVPELLNDTFNRLRVLMSQK